MFKRVLSSAICLIMVMSYTAIGADAVGEQEISAPAGVLMEAQTGKILYEKDSHSKRACASVTKVMTLLLVMEAIEDGRLKYADTLSASAHASSMGGSDIWLEEGETMSVDDLVKATAVASANDAAVVLAEAVSGSEEGFVALMNKRASKLKMKDTVFKNCNGLDQEGHLTSAYDVALMSRELVKHKKIFDYTSIWLDTLRGGKTQIVNTNKLLKTYKGITGLKTGTTDDAGCCMSATATREGLSLIAVVLGCDNGTSRFADAAALMNFGFANYTVQALSLPKKALKSAGVSGGMTDRVRLKCQEPGSLVVGRSGNEKITRECKIKKDIQAPVKKGDVLGEVNYYSGSEKLKSCKITAGNNVERMTFSALTGAIFASVTSL